MREQRIFQLTMAEQHVCQMTTLQEKSPGISRVLGPRNPGLMEEKPPLRRPTSALNIPAFPGYTWMQGSPQASRGAIATRDP